MVDFSVLFDRLGEQFTLLVIMLQRVAVQRQVAVILGVLLLAWAASRMLPWTLRLAAEPYHPDRPDADAGGAQQPQRASLRTQIVRGLQAFDFIVFPALLLLLTYRAVHWLDLNGWPSGLIDALKPIFWLLLVYRLLVRVVLAALPKDQSERFASELLRPVVWILILLILRNILFSTLGLGEISLLRLGELTLNLGDLLDAAIVLLLALIIGGAVRKVLINVLVPARWRRTWPTRSAAWRAMGWWPWARWWGWASWASRSARWPGSAALCWWASALACKS